MGGMTPQDSIIGPSRGDADTALTYAKAHGAQRLDFLADYLHQVYALCQPDGMPDASIVVAQSAHETGGDNGAVWISSWFVQRGNVAGMGITGDPTQNAASPTFASGVQAARAQIAHLLLYATGQINRGGLTPSDDPRYAAYQDAYGATPEATTIAQLAGKWGTDPQYAQGVCARGNAIFPALPDAGATPVSTTTAAPSAPPTDDTHDLSQLNMTRGLIPLPAFIDDIIDVSQRSTSLDCRGYDYLGARSNPPEFLVLHRSQDPPGQSNSGYFHETCCPALTDFEVLATTGQGRRFVDIAKSNVAGWANGVVSSPYGDALKYLNYTGWDLNRVNRNGEACEITGWFAQPGSSITADSPVSDAAWAWLAQWIASRAHDYGIPWFQFPIIPKENSRSYVTWHQEWTIGTGKVCPGQVVMDYTPTLFQQAAAIMKAAQTAHLATTTTTTTPAPKGAPSGPYAAAVPVPGPVRDQTYHGTPMFAFVHQMETVRDGVRCLAAGSPHAAETRAPLPKGTRINTAYLYRSATDGNAYVIGTGGSRVLLSDLAPVLAPAAAATSGK